MTARASPETGAGRSAPPSWASGLWGLAESSFFFLVPDIILGWACLAGPKAGLRSLGAILAGSLGGGLAMYGFAVVDPEGARAFVDAVPFVAPWMFDTVSDAYQSHGAVGMLYGPSSGIPYKIYAILAPMHFDALTFAAMTIPARLERLALSWLAFTLIGHFFQGWLAAHRRSVFLLYLLFWLAVYAIYWSSL